MTDRKDRKIYPKMNHPLACLVLGGWACFLLGAALWGMSDGFTKWLLPFWKLSVREGLFVAAVLVAWFGMALLFCRLLILGLEFVVIDREEVKFCLGPIVLRRLHFSEVSTVIRTGGDLSEWPQTPLRSIYPKKKSRNLVFSTKTEEELRTASRTQTSKRKANKQQVRMQDPKMATNQEVKRYFERRMLITPFWMEWSTDAEVTLLSRMTTTVFIL